MGVINGPHTGCEFFTLVDGGLILQCGSELIYRRLFLRQGCSMTALRQQTDTGQARFQRAERKQMEWREYCLDRLLDENHTARLVWAYVESLDLTELYARIRAVEGATGRSPIDPKILLALWLMATVDGVGSARRLDRLCEQQLPYQWLCGRVSVNYHTLSDFRVEHAEFLDRLLTQSVAVLLHQGLVELTRIAQDGMRVRASAGAGSFRRKPTLDNCLKEARQHLEALKAEAREDTSAEDRRVKAARERAARERKERIEAALAEREKLASKMERRKKGSGEQARASMTDPEARKMKMGDGGFRPAYNVQFATAAESLVIVGVDVTNAGTDGGQMKPMVEQIEDRHGTRPDEYLADGGFVSLDDITHLEKSGITTYLPIMEQQQKRAKGIDPFAPVKGDSEEVKQWRARMGTESAGEIYRQRAVTAEFPNATCRNRELRQFNVRGLIKAKAVTLWQALAHNFQRTLDLRQKAGLALV
jgi:transposase